MQYKIGTLIFIKSKNSPVFDEVVNEVIYSRKPVVGEAFTFVIESDCGTSNLSTVKKITKFKGFSIIQTRNSYYALCDKEEL